MTAIKPLRQPLSELVDHGAPPRSFVADFQAALLNRPYQGISAAKVKPTLRVQVRYLVALWTVGLLLMISATWLMAWLAIFDHPGTAILVYLLIITFLSLLDSFLTSAVFSVIATLCLSYFFKEPRYSFEVADAQDLIALFTFVGTSLAITTLVRRARQFGEAQHEQATLLELTPDAILVLDDNRVITYWNHGAEMLFGWTREEAIGKVVNRLLKTVYPAPLDELLEISRRTGQWEGELIQTTRDGAEVFVASKWTVRRDAWGNPIGMLQSNTDVTARKRAEQALLKSQDAYLAEAQRLSHTGSFGWNITTGELTWSEETFRIFECPPASKPTLRMVLDRAHPEDVPRIKGVIDRAAADRRPLDFEYRLRMPDGSSKTLHVVARLSVDHPGDTFMIGAVKDITARKVAYDALEASELRYRYLFKFMPISLWKLDVRGLAEMFDELKAAQVTEFPAYLDAHPEFVARAMDVIVAEEVNDASVRMFGAKDQHELLGSIAPRFRARPDTMRRILEKRFRGESVFEEKTQLVAVDGRLIEVLMTSAQTDAGMALAGIVELTDLVQTQETLEKLQIEFTHAARVSTLGELTASIAHELNQPLGAIAVNCEASLRWLDRPNPDLDEVHVLTKRSLAEARRTADIIDRVRAMAARRPPERVLVPLHDVILEALQFLRHEVEWRGITVSHLFSARSSNVMADRTLLQQLIVNLAVNAMQAMARVGATERRITIRTASPDETLLHCSVEDSGPGIEQDDLSRLFESFFTTKQAGMGMGLSVCRSIIEAHGGRIEADNGSAHGGARFSFTLPMANNTLQ